MALIDRARDVYFDRARERWKHKGFDTDITGQRKRRHIKLRILILILNMRRL